MSVPSGGFFYSSQIEARCHFYWFDMNKSENITFYSHNGWVFKVIQAVSIVIWMDSEQISPVCSFQLVGLLWTDEVVRKLNCHVCYDILFWNCKRPFPVSNHPTYYCTLDLHFYRNGIHQSLWWGKLGCQIAICRLKKELSMLHGALNIFLEIKLLFVKIEIWNF